jgi:hypothetical protein
MQHSTHPFTITNETIVSFIGDVMGTIGADKTMIELGVATEETKVFWNNLATRDIDQLTSANKKLTTAYFTKKVMYHLLVELNNAGLLQTVKISFGLSTDAVLAWAIIKDGDSETEDKIYIVEASINAKFHEFHFGVSFIVVEESDNIPIPGNYKSITKEQA